MALDALSDISTRSAHDTQDP